MHEFKLAGYSLREAKNLGVSLSEDGPLDSKAVKRIEKLNNVLRVFRRLGVFTHGVHPARSIRLYKPLGRSRWEYGMHLKRRTRRRSQEDARYVLRTNLGKRRKENRYVPNIVQLAIVMHQAEEETTSELKIAKYQWRRSKMPEN